MNIGDKYLKMNNPEDVSSMKIFRVDDVFEMSLTENVYECTLIQYKNGEEKLYSDN
jgi:hypothetical protein